MTQDPHQSGPSGSDGGPNPPQPPSGEHPQLPDYRPAATGGPGQVPGTGQYANPVPANTSAVILSIISGVLTLSGICCVVGIVPLVLGILGITQNASDPQHAQKLTRIGWVVLVVLSLLFALAILGAILFVATGNPSVDGYTAL